MEYRTLGQRSWPHTCPVGSFVVFGPAGCDRSFDRPSESGASGGPDSCFRKNPV